MFLIYSDINGPSLHAQLNPCIISDFIEGQINKGKPEDCIHAIWYCINGTRFDNNEKQFILEFQKAYPDNKIPIILIYTQANKPTQVKKFRNGCIYPNE